MLIPLKHHHQSIKGQKINPKNPRVPLKAAKGRIPTRRQVQQPMGRCPNILESTLYQMECHSHQVKLFLLLNSNKLKY